MLDDTVGYGKILELEKLVEEGDESKAHEELLNEMKIFEISEPTSKEEFNEKFEYYKRNWKSLVNKQNYEESSRIAPRGLLGALFMVGIGFVITLMLIPAN